jgi:hypothetical protein
MITFFLILLLLPPSEGYSTLQGRLLLPVKVETKRSFQLNSSLSTTDSLLNPHDSKQTILEPLAVGVKRDFSHRLPNYLTDDITDGLNAQSLATILYLFFACLAPAIGFGATLAKASGGLMGVMEMTLATAICGTLYSLIAPQPMQIIGPMGPNLAFTISLYQLATLLKLPFLPLYAWTGLWTAGFLATAALTSASNIVKHLTKFTDEIFAILISAIFVSEAILDIFQVLLSPTTTATKALLTLTCAVITFGSALMLRGLGKSIYFTKSIRTNLANFAPALGVTVGTLVARWFRCTYGLNELASLTLPTQFATTSGRSWLVSLTALPVWARWAASVPAAFFAVLLFLDQSITARIVNNPRWKMIKGKRQTMIDGMHGDLLVLSILTGVCSVVGLPWMAGGTTRSAAHIRSQAVYDENGQEVLRNLENRVTGTIIHVLIGACVLFPGPRQLLSLVPLPVLSGVFLYLGFTSLQGLDLWDRVLGLFQDSTLASPKPWTGIARSTTTLYTLLQVAFVALLMRVTKSSWGVMSPLLIALLPLARRGLTKVVKEDQSLQILDE